MIALGSHQGGWGVLNFCVRSSPPWVESDKREQSKTLTDAIEGGLAFLGHWLLVLDLNVRQIHFIFVALSQELGLLGLADLLKKTQTLCRLEREQAPGLSAFHRKGAQLVVCDPRFTPVIVGLADQKKNPPTVVMQ